MAKQNDLPPTYYENFVCYDNERYFKKIKEIEWRGQIASSSNGKKFKIKYYGNLFEKYHLIVATEFAPALVYAVDIETNEEVLLFDGCRHGYNPMLCDSFTTEQFKNRPTTNFYTDKSGADIFEVVVSAYYSIDYDEEIEDFQDEDGNIELISGEAISKDTLKRNGFDHLTIKVFNTNGQETSIIEEELA